MGELNEHRSRMSKLSEESGHNRDSLMAANAQLASLRAQLDRAMDDKVSKKMNQRMKVSQEVLHCSLYELIENSVSEGKDGLFSPRWHNDHITTRHDTKRRGSTTAGYTYVKR